MPVGGVEIEIALFPADVNSPRTFLECIRDRLSSEGGFIHAHDRNKFFTAEGDCIGWEGGNVLEVSTGEKADFLTLVDSVVRLKRTVARAIADAKNTSPVFLATTTPSVIPGHPGFRPGYHLNIDAEQMTYQQSMNLVCALAALVLFTGSGGLFNSGFCLSPKSTHMIDSFIQDGRESFLSHRCMMTEKKCIVYLDQCKEERRLHISCFDAPFTRTGLAVQFGLVQIIVGMLRAGVMPAGGMRLKDITCAYMKWSDNPREKVQLDGNGCADSHEFVLAFRRSLAEYRRRFEIEEKFEILADWLLKGIDAFLAGDGEYLAENFQGYTKRLIYRRIAEAHGVSLERFNAAFSAVRATASLLGTSLYRLGQIQRGDMRKRMRSATDDRFQTRSWLIRYVQRHRIELEELPLFASLANKLIAVELHLGQIFPGPSPIENHDLQVWETFRSKFPESLAVATRADARGKLVRELNKSRLGSWLVADWANIVRVPPGKPSHVEIMVMEKPGNEEYVFRDMKAGEVLPFKDLAGWIPDWIFARVPVTAKQVMKQHDGQLAFEFWPAVD